MLALAAVPPFVFAGATPGADTVGNPPVLEALAASAVAGETTPIDDLVANMTRREKAAQVVMAPVSGRSLSSADRDLLRDGLGGVILFSFNYRDPAQLRRLNAAIQEAARASRNGFRVLISADQEGGVVKRFPELAPSYGAPAADTLARARAMGSATGEDLREVGVRMNLAPVADRDRGPARVMRLRAFGREVSTVRARVEAYLEGLLPTNVGAALKHYPGLGAAPMNSDDGRTVVRLTRDEILIDEQPFTLAQDRVRAAVMLSNAIYPAIEPGVPAGLSRAMYQRLRARVGGLPLAITDALQPLAWAVDGVVSRACPRAIAAGADVALLTGDRATTRSCIERIVDAARDGRISAARLDQAVMRVLRYKRALGLLP